MSLNNNNNNNNTIGKQREHFKLFPKEKFISTSLLNGIIEKTDLNNVLVEESNSELWYESINGFGNITFKNKVQYLGNVKYGILHNENIQKPCKLSFPNGIIYEGQMNNNQISGEGKFIFPDGSEYIGGVLNGLRHGKGTFKAKNGTIFSGEWKFGLKDGEGKEEQDQISIEGNWVKGSMNGKSRIKWKSGNFYCGNLIDNKLNGDGFMVWQNKNEKYSGLWKENKQNGIGIYIWYNGKGMQKYFRDRYVGEWRNGKRNGYGMFYYTNGSIYEGFWKNNKKEGFGIFYFPNRTYFKGCFKEDNKVNEETILELKNIFEKRKRELLTNKSKKTENTKNNNFSSNKILINLQNNNNNNNNNNNENNKNNKSNQNEENSKEEKKHQKEKEKKKHQKEKLEKINKELDEIKIELDISDLIELDPSIESDLKEIDRVLLRNLSLMTHLYMYACGRENIKDSDIGLSTIAPSNMENKVINNKNNNNNNKNNEKNEKNNKDEEKKENIDFDNIYNNNLYFCLDLEKFWKLIREVGLIDENFNLVDVDRIYYRNKNNYINMNYIPDEVVKEKNDEKIYDYLYQYLNKNKKDFEFKNKQEIESSNNICDKINEINKNIREQIKLNNNNLKNENNKDENQEINNNNEYLSKYSFYLINDIHDRRNTILLRSFYELLIRVAYIKYKDIEGSLSSKLKTLFMILKSFFKAKRKNPTMSFINLNVIDNKINNYDSHIQKFIEFHYINLNSLFEDIYYCNNFNLNKNLNNNNDKTITYNYFYNKVIKRTKKINNIYVSKLNFVELMIIYHKEKKFKIKNEEENNENNSNKEEENEDKQKLFYDLKNIFNNEMIKFEFFEILFYICRKYIKFYNIQIIAPKSNKNNKKNNSHLKSFLSRKNSNLPQGRNENDVYKEVLELFNETVRKNKNSINNLKKYKYDFPKIKNHELYEKMKEDERQRQLEKERKEKEKIRYEKERKNFENEDSNVYKEEDDNQSESEDYSDY
jgi:hypothetical protein